MPATEDDIKPISLTSNQLRAALEAIGAQEHPVDDEHRRTQRMAYRRRDLRVSILDEEWGATFSFLAATRDISRHGIAFFHRQMLAVGQMLRIDLPLPGQNGITMMAQVVRCRYIRDLVHEIGVEFVKKPGGSVATPSEPVAEPGTMAERGLLKWFDVVKGVGFIQPDAGGPDVFVAAADVVGDPAQVLAEGKPVTFELRTSPAGSKALKVTPTGD